MKTFNEIKTRIAKCDVVKKEIEIQRWVKLTIKKTSGGIKI